MSLGKYGKVTGRKGIWNTVLESGLPCQGIRELRGLTPDCPGKHNHKLMMNKINDFKHFEDTTAGGEGIVTCAELSP